MSPDAIGPRQSLIFIAIAYKSTRKEYKDLWIAANKYNDRIFFPFVVSIGDVITAGSVYI